MDKGTCLYRRYLAGDEQAFNELMNLYHDGLILFISKYINNYSVAEELAADSFVELIVHKKRFLGKSSFRTYLYSIGRYKAIDYIRKKSKESSISIEEIAAVPCDELVEEAFIRDTEKRELYKAISILDYEYRAAVYLVFFEGMSYESAAHALGKSKKQIDNLIYRAKGMLKGLMGNGGDLDAQH